MKKIITHFNPDLDAIGSVWLLKRFSQDFTDATVFFVPAGNTYQNVRVDEDEEIVHVDTGLGKFDHHQLENKKICAMKLAFNWLKIQKEELEKDKSLIQLIEVVRKIDHFEEVTWPNPLADYFHFQLDALLDGLKIAGKVNDHGLIEFGLTSLDGIYAHLKITNKALKELAEGVKFETKWGKAIGCLTRNNEVLKVGQKQGFVIVVQKDPQTEHVRIKGRPDSQVDLTSAQKTLSLLDPQATWFLHVSKKMLLNGSTKNDKMRPSKLSLKKVIEVLSLIR